VKEEAVVEEAQPEVEDQVEANGVASAEPSVQEEAAEPEENGVNEASEE